jgi:hypothetical protein
VKIVAVLLLLLLVIGGAKVTLAQNPVVELEMRDGVVARVPTDSIASIITERSNTDDSVSEANFFALPAGLGNPQTYRLVDIDSITFGDSTGTPLMYVWGIDWVRSPLAFKIGGVPINRYGVRIDSITFTVRIPNSNVIKLSDESVWSLAATNDRLFSSPDSVSSFAMSDDFALSPPRAEPSSHTVFNVAADPNSHRYSYVSSNEWGVSDGTLFERDPEKDSSWVIDSPHASSAVYVAGTGDLVYYSYGSYTSANPNPLDAGYYVERRSDGSKHYLLHYISPLGPAEVVNGFDVSPDGRYIFIPMTFAAATPIVVRYNIQDSSFDTIKSNFAQPKLWLRSSVTGDTLLYSNYSNTAIDAAPLGISSEIGLLDLSSGNQSVLDVDVDRGSSWSNIFPCWAYRWKTIIYLSTSVSTEPAGVALGYKLRALLHFN